MYSNIIITLGFLVAVSPFLGFPISFKNPFYFLAGLAIAYFAFRQKNLKKKSSTFRRVYRKPKAAVSLSVNEAPRASGEDSLPANLAEGNGETK
jgi:hypothetical protein